MLEYKTKFNASFYRDKLFNYKNIEEALIKYCKTNIGAFKSWYYNTHITMGKPYVIPEPSYEQTISFINYIDETRDYSKLLYLRDFCFDQFDFERFLNQNGYKRKANLEIAVEMSEYLNRVKDYIKEKGVEHSSVFAEILHFKQDPNTTDKHIKELESFIKLAKQLGNIFENPELLIK